MACCSASVCPADPVPVRLDLQHCKFITLPVKPGSSTITTADGQHSSSRSSSRCMPAPPGLPFVFVELPDVRIDVSINKDLVKQLTLTPLVAGGPPQAAPEVTETAADSAPSTESQRHIQQARDRVSYHTETVVGGVAQEMTVAVARVQGLLVNNGSSFNLLPLPTFTKPDAVAATVELQQQPSEQLMWGLVSLETLLKDLEVGRG